MSIWHPTAQDATSNTRIQFNGQDGHWTLVERTQDVTGEWTERRLILHPTQTKIALDFGTLYVGPIKFGARGPDFSRLRPVHEPAPESGDIDPEFREGFRLGVVTKPGGRGLFANNSVLGNNVIKALYDDFTVATEAQTGNLAVYAVLPSRQVRIQARDAMFFAPVLELVGWIPRNDTVFGKRIVPPPQPLLESDPPDGERQLCLHRVGRQRHQPQQQRSRTGRRSTLS